VAAGRTVGVNEHDLIGIGDDVAPTRQISPDPAMLPLDWKQLGSAR
jgi:hypothetical protein